MCTNDHCTTTGSTMTTRQRGRRVRARSLRRNSPSSEMMIVAAACALAAMMMISLLLSSLSGPSLVTEAAVVAGRTAAAAFAVRGRITGPEVAARRPKPKWLAPRPSVASASAATGGGGGGPRGYKVPTEGVGRRSVGGLSAVSTAASDTRLWGLPDSESDSGGDGGGAPLASLEGEDEEGGNTDDEPGMGSSSSSSSSGVEVDVEVDAVGLSTTTEHGENVTELEVGLELGLEVEGVDPSSSDSSVEEGVAVDDHVEEGGWQPREGTNGEATLSHDHRRTEDDPATEEFLTGPMLTLPRHSNASNVAVNTLLDRTELFLRTIHRDATLGDASSRDEEDENDFSHPKSEHVFANSYVDLGKIDTIGFDFDYTLATYSHRLLSLIYDMALDRLVRDKQYPVEMRGALTGKFDAFFSIRGLAVDRETGWICHLSYTHKVAVAWEGRNRLPSERLVEEYKGKRSMTPAERRNRLKPLNDLFSMAECCLIADVVQFFNDRNIPYFPRSCVEDILSVIGSTHVSGDFHREVAANPELYFEEQPHLAGVLQTLKESGKKLIFVSNSPFWYVHAGMNYVIGPDWRDAWDAVITSAGKPRFYTDDARPFREVSTRTGRIKFKRIDRLEPGEVYTEGCLKELTRCLDWSTEETSEANEMESQTNAGYSLASPNVLYVGDSLFADLVDAKREFGWTTAAVLPEVGRELELQGRTRYALSQQTIELLIHTLRRVQEELGRGMRSAEDDDLIDGLEGLVSAWRDEQTRLLGNPFGSVFRARFQPSLFAHSLRRYCDLYMTGVESLRLYSPEHRFYPEDARLLGHEITGLSEECWNFDDI